MMPVLGLLAASLVLAQPATLQYQFRPGAAWRYAVRADAETTVQVGDATPSVGTAKTSMTIGRKVLSRLGDRAVVEDTVLEGVTDTQVGQQRSTRAADAFTTVSTLTPTGKPVKTERRAPPGVADPGPQFLEGLGFRLPGRPVQPGATWEDTQVVPNRTGEKMTVHCTFRYVGDTTRAGRKCARISAAFRSAFTGVSRPTNTQYTGSLTGAGTLFLAREAGRDLESVMSLTVVMKATRDDNGSKVPYVSTNRLAIRQTMVP